MRVSRHQPHIPPSLSLSHRVQVAEIRHPGRVYSELMNVIVRLARHGLIHGDFNEFNLLIDDEERVTMIDFPQMVSTTHENADMYVSVSSRCSVKFNMREERVSAHHHYGSNRSHAFSMNIGTLIAMYSAFERTLHESLATSRANIRASRTMPNERSISMSRLPPVASHRRTRSS